MCSNTAGRKGNWGNVWIGETRKGGGELGSHEKRKRMVLFHFVLPAYLYRICTIRPRKNATLLGLTGCWKERRCNFRDMLAGVDSVEQRVTKVPQIRGEKDRSYRFRTDAIRVWWTHAKCRLMWAWLSMSYFRTSHGGGLARWVATPSSTHTRDPSGLSEQIVLHYSTLVLTDTSIS